MKYTLRTTERYEAWLIGLRDKQARYRIVARVERLAAG